MPSPYGGDRGGGRKSTRLPGGQPGNVNRRASKLLPKQKDTMDRRAFLDALAEAETMTADEQTVMLRNMGFARVVSLAEEVGIGRILEALSTIDTHRLTEDKLRGRDRATRREALKDQALGEVWQHVGQCEQCAVLVDQVLTGLQLSLHQIGGGTNGQAWLDRKDDGDK